MVTSQDILNTPVTGYNYIDALLASGPDWNFVTSDGSTFRTTLYYSFSTEGAQYETKELQAFNIGQQQAARDILAYVTKVTGIQFAETSSSAAADIHFANADIIDPALGGVAYSSYTYNASTSGKLTSYTADAYIYLDSKGASNLSPVAGTWGYQALLHEVGHALGLKHPFEATQDAPTILIPPYQDTTAQTVMSYTQASSDYFSQFSEYDLAALNFLYGTDGLRGAWGVGSSGLYLTGASLDSSFTPPSGRTTLTDMGGTDTVNYAGAQKDYSIIPTRDKMWLHVSNADTDDLISSSIEYLSFGNTVVDTKTLLDPKGWITIGTDAADLLIGTAGGDLIYGSSGNDVLLGSGGDDLLVGGDGLDIAVFKENASDAIISNVDSVLTLSDRYGDSSLASIERVQFLDCKVALDLDTNESAGMAALLTVATKGKEALFDHALLGEMISVFDSGIDMHQACEQVVNASWFQTMTGGSNIGFVNLVYKHVVGSDPTAADQNLFINMLQGHGGSMGQADLLEVATLSQINQDSINLISLQQTGLAYT